MVEMVVDGVRVSLDAAVSARAGRAAERCGMTVPEWVAAMLDEHGRRSDALAALREYAELYGVPGV